MAVAASTTASSANSIVSPAIVPPTSRTWLKLAGPSRPCRSSSTCFCSAGVRGGYLRMYPPPPVWMTEPLSFSAATAFSTVVRDGLLAKLTVNSVPPAKSMPSRKPLVAIETMPGMMIRSDTAKKMFRRPMMLSFRTRGSRTAGVGALSLTVASAEISDACSGTMSDTAAPVDTQQPGSPQARGRHDDGQKVVGDHDRRDEARHDADAEGDGEALHLRRPDEAEDHAGYERRSVGVADGRPRAPDRCVDRSGDRSPGPDLFFEPLEYQHVGIHGHAHREDEPGDAGERQCHRHDLEHRQHGARVKE